MTAVGISVGSCCFRLSLHRLFSQRRRLQRPSCRQVSHFPRLLLLLLLRFLLLLNLLLLLLLSYDIPAKIGRAERIILKDKIRSTLKNLESLPLEKNASYFFLLLHTGCPIIR